MCPFRVIRKRAEEGVRLNRCKHLSSALYLVYDWGDKQSERKEKRAGMIRAEPCVSVRPEWARYGHARCVAWSSTRRSNSARTTPRNTARVVQAAVAGGRAATEDPYHRAVVSGASFAHNDEGGLRSCASCRSVDQGGSCTQGGRLYVSWPTVGGAESAGAPLMGAKGAVAQRAWSGHRCRRMPGFSPAKEGRLVCGPAGTRIAMHKRRPAIT